MSRPIVSSDTNPFIPHLTLTTDLNSSSDLNPNQSLIKDQKTIRLTPVIHLQIFPKAHPQIRQAHPVHLRIRHQSHPTILKQARLAPQKKAVKKLEF